MPEEKKLDLSKSVYELCGRYPELTGIMDELGFHDIVKPGMLPTAGRFMTIPKGAAMKRMKLDAIVAGLKKRDSRSKEALAMSNLINNREHRQR